jgi:hypothetical protein
MSLLNVWPAAPRSRKTSPNARHAGGLPGAAVAPEGTSQQASGVTGIPPVRPAPTPVPPGPSPGRTAAPLPPVCRRLSGRSRLSPVSWCLNSGAGAPLASYPRTPKSNSLAAACRLRQLEKLRVAFFLHIDRGCRTEAPTCSWSAPHNTAIPGTRSNSSRSRRKPLVGEIVHYISTFAAPDAVQVTFPRPTRRKPIRSVRRRSDRRRHQAGDARGGGVQAFKQYPGRPLQVEGRRVMTAIREGKMDATGTPAHVPGLIPNEFDDESVGGTEPAGRCPGRQSPAPPTTSTPVNPAKHLPPDQQPGELPFLTPTGRRVTPGSGARRSQPRLRPPVASALR